MVGSHQEMTWYLKGLDSIISPALSSIDVAVAQAQGNGM